MSLEVRALRAIAHPLRLRLLSLLTGAEMSAAEAARELAITQPNASYHLRVLREAGLLVEAGEVKIRGGVAKRYKHPWQQGAGGSGPALVDDSRLFTEAVAQELVRRSGARASLGRSCTTDAEVWVKMQVWQEAVDLVQRASALIHASARPPRTHGTHHVSMTAVLFEMTDPEAVDDDVS